HTRFEVRPTSPPMQIDFTTTPADLDEVDLLVLPVRDGAITDAWRERAGPGFERTRADLDRTKTATLVYPAGGPRLVLVPADGDAEAQRAAAAGAAATANALQVETVGLAVPEGADPVALVEGLRLGAYRYTRYKTKGDDAWPGPSRLVVQATEARRAAVERAGVVTDAVILARDLVNRSPDETTAQGLGALAKEAGEAAGLVVEVWDRARIEAEGMGGLLCVNRGSVEPPAFLVMEHRPEAPVLDRPIVLVGKAVTFDTGGLSLKPTKGSMDTMKADMAGGAAVIGAMVALARLGLPLPVVALVPSTDNRPGENAFVPGDVVRMHDGTTVEILNTDAEGRMLLADALSYARRYDPALVVDVATLTGSIVVALGDRVAGLFTNEDDGARDRLDRFTEAGRATGELVWPMPTFDFYKEALKSDVADLQNLGGREGQASTAAVFLEHFTRNADGNGYPWVHLDIAGPAFLTRGRAYLPAGGTGFGVRLLVEVLRGLAGGTGAA